MDEGADSLRPSWANRQTIAAVNCAAQLTLRLTAFFSGILQILVISWLAFLSPEIGGTLQRPYPALLNACFAFLRTVSTAAVFGPVASPTLRHQVARDVVVADHTPSDRASVAISLSGILATDDFSYRESGKRFGRLPIDVDNPCRRLALGTSHAHTASHAKAKTKKKP